MEFLDCRASVYAADPLIVGPRSAATPERKGAGLPQPGIRDAQIKVGRHGAFDERIKFGIAECLPPSGKRHGGMVVPPSWASLQLAGV